MHQPVLSLSLDLAGQDFYFLLLWDVDLTWQRPDVVLQSHFLVLASSRVSEYPIGQLRVFHHGLRLEARWHE